MTTETTTTPAEVKTERTKKTALKPCACSFFEIGEDFTNANGEPDRTIETTECTRQTHRIFAQGHDAALASFLVRAEYDGQTIWRADGGLLTTYSGAAHAASSVSEALAEKAEKALANLRARSAAKADRAAVREAARAEREAAKAQAKAEKEAAKAAKTEQAEPPRDVPVRVIDTAPAQAEERGLVKIKVGRWEYDATIDDSGVATFRDSNGVEQTREQGTYRVLEG